VVQGSVDYLLATFQVTQDHDSWVAMRGDAPPELELWGVDDLGSVSVAGGAPQDVQVLLHAWGPLGHLQMLLSDENDPSLSQDQLGTLIGMGGDAGDPRTQGGFSRMLGEAPAGFLTSWGRKTGLFDQFVLSSPYVDSAVAQETPGEGDSEEGAPLAVAGVGAPPAGSSSQPVNQLPVSNTVKSLAEVSVGKYVGSKLFVGVNTQVMEHTDVVNGIASESYEPAVGGVVEYQLPGSSKISVQDSVDTDGQTDYRAMLEGSTSFDNYNPSRRRWDGVATMTPTPVPGTPPVPSSALTPDFGP
ncbi:MAG TPA: hypothetical protein VK786_00770, partial [bacterium]|nr:hypothetical protein [bacterium]